MNWMQSLVETYDRCYGKEPPGSSEPLWPIGHTAQQAHVEITVDEAGEFISAKVVAKEKTVVPATEESAGRTSKPAPHPLCDKIFYCAGDYPAFGGVRKSGYVGFEKQLAAWCNSADSHPKACAVLKYIRRQAMISDLVSAKVLFIGRDGHLIDRWPDEATRPEIFKFLQEKNGRRDQGEAFVRWQVREANNPSTAVWEDKALQQAWIQFNASQATRRGLCTVTGEEDVALARSHPRRIRHEADGAKLISSNDGQGFTFRGRFTDSSGDQACAVGTVTTQKAHTALGWLIRRQGFRNGDQVVVAWAVSGAAIPDPFADTQAIFLGAEATGAESSDKADEVDDVGQAFGRRLRRVLAGYSANLTHADRIVVMGVDSATPGRMAITYYRDLTGSDFLARVLAWHESYAWQQNNGVNGRFVGAPAPKAIAEAAYGRRLDDPLRKATVERLLSCIVDGVRVPRDLVESAVRRACQRTGQKKEEKNEWERTLGVACALYRGFHSDREEFRMTLELERNSRDYLFGRLLALAEHIEERALYVAGEERDTNAARLMQRFADRPSSSWRALELALRPYFSRLRVSRAGFLVEMQRTLDEIISRFDSNEFVDDRRLSGEFLLAYHCQREALRAKREPEPDRHEADTATTATTTGE